MRSDIRNVPRLNLPSRYMEVDPDVDLCFDDKIIPGHSQLLSLWSNVLKEAIKAGSGSESNGGRSQLLSIPMTGTSSTDWLKIVPFIYPDEQQEVTWDNLEALLVLGDKYDISGLATRAANFLDANQNELKGDDKDSKYIWKWILLLDSAAAGSEAMYEICIQRAALFFKNTCTRANMKELSKEEVEVLASTMAATMPISSSIKGICPRCKNRGIDQGSARAASQKYYCSRCSSFFA